MGTQITWYCPVNITTSESATRTCSFSPAFRVLMNKNTSPPERTGKNLINIYWLTCRCAKRWVWSCTTLGITPLFFIPFFFHMFYIHAKSSGSMYHKISTERSIAFIAESINKTHMATRTVTIVSKNVVQL